jgi:hypothetical protein
MAEESSESSMKKWLQMRPLLAFAYCLLTVAPVLARAAGPTTGEPGQGAAALPAVIREMAGTWSVKQWMWPAPASRAIALPPAVAHRRIIDGQFLQEIMSATAGSEASFKRIAYFDYNAVTGRFEYFSIDTRAPQMMNERSIGRAGAGGEMRLYGGMFVAPQWGSARNSPFRYELIVDPVQGNTQTVELYLTPVPASRGPRFLAFKYLYTRRGAAASARG